MSPEHERPVLCRRRDGVFYPATCDETQVINRNQRKETFNRTFDAAMTGGRARRG
jgi:hypothetical protein